MNTAAENTNTSLPTCESSDLLYQWEDLTKSLVNDMIYDDPKQYYRHKPAATLQIVPKTLQHNVLNRKTFGSLTPFKITLISEMPDPAATGATKDVHVAATSANMRFMAFQSPSETKIGDDEDIWACMT